MDAFDVLETRNFVLHVQFAALEFPERQIVCRGVKQSFCDLLFECFVSFLQFNKMRLHRHMGNLQGFDLANTWCHEARGLSIKQSCCKAAMFPESDTCG